MQINKSEGHIHFYIDRCTLKELVIDDYNLLSINLISEILWPDTDKLSDEEMITISKILNGEET